MLYLAFAIIRNSKYKRKELNLIYRHNERKNTNYSNTNIDRNKSYLNYSLKKCYSPYTTSFNEIRKKYNLKGQLKVTNNIACEYIITASPEFFINIGTEETKRYFECAYQFISNYKNLGSEYILSARVHMDESTPHMHLVYIPVVHTIDKKTGKNIDKISCTEFWYGKNSYKALQDNYYKYMIKCGFDLERSKNIENTHINIKDLKIITNYEEQQYLNKTTPHIEQELKANNVDEIKNHYKKVITKCNTLTQQYTKIKSINEINQKTIDDLNNKYSTLKKDYHKLEKTCKNLKKYIHNSFECISHLIGWSFQKLKSVVDNYITQKEIAENQKQDDLLQDKDSLLIDTEDEKIIEFKKGFNGEFYEKK